MTGPIVVIMADNVPVANKYEPVKYDFTWNVYDSPTANNYGQREARDGDSTVGSYHVLLPDGRTQKVSYTVDSYGGMYFRDTFFSTMMELISLLMWNQLQMMST